MERATHLQCDPEREILDLFSPEEQKEILSKRQVLSSIAYFIGKDFRMPIELGLPTPECESGWMQGKKADGSDFLQINARDLIEKPMEYLRFVIAHEGGHRRVSRILGVIPQEVWQEPGFPMLMNALEDPRVNNFIAEGYPYFKERMNFAYEHDAEQERKMSAEACETLGRQPKFMQAAFEYLKMWIRETKGEEEKISDDVDDEVASVVGKTLPSAKDVWWTYPSKEEADKNEQVITEYAKASYKILYEKVWPEFKKLIDQDIKDQESSETLQGKDGEDVPKELENNLTEEEKQELKEAIEKAFDEAMKSGGGGEGKEGEVKTRKPSPIDPTKLSEALQKKIKEYIDSLSEEEKQTLTEKAEKAIQTLAEKAGEKMSTAFPEPNNQPTEENSDDEPQKNDSENQEAKSYRKTPKSENREENERKIEEYRKIIEEKISGNENEYEKNRTKIIPIIDRLETDLRDIFVERRLKGWNPGHRSGKRINIQKRMGEKAKGVPSVQSRAWERRELPMEKDYAISILVDLSGSMKGENIDEAFKGVIAITEALNRLSINIEILGFNDKMYEYRKYGDAMSDAIREKMGEMLQRVSESAARWNDDGFAVRDASDRLGKQSEAVKILIVISDGIPEESKKHKGPEYELGTVVSEIERETDQLLIGLGLGENTEHVTKYYPNSLANVSVEEMTEKLADLIKEVIEHPESFK
jgi:hypothetical protein